MSATWQPTLAHHKFGLHTKKINTYYKRKYALYMDVEITSYALLCADLFPTFRKLIP